jgi:TolB-like protein
MSSIVPGYEYDIFISYRQKDNKGDKWVSEFVDTLKNELESTFKEDISIYFDEDLHDRLQETHNVDKSLEGKLKCLIFIPILSQTYCDPKSYAWKDEFLTFLKMAENDCFGQNVKLRSGNVASRLFPIRIHDLEKEDVKLFEKETGSVMRAMDFVFKTSTGVNRPLKAIEDHPEDNLNKTFYSDQINKTANAIKEIILGLKTGTTTQIKRKIRTKEPFNEAGNEDNRKKLISKPVGYQLSKKWIIIMIFMFLSIVGVFGIYLIKNNRTQNQTTEKLEKSIAVLPFVNDSPDKENEYFCNGVMEEILNQLQKIGDLKVKARTSVEKYRNTDKDIKVIGRELGVSLIMEGSVRKVGDDLRITAQLIDTRTGDHLWSETYDGKYTTAIFDFQSSVAKKVAVSLNAVITPQEAKRIDIKPTSEMLAFDLCARGEEMIRKWRYTKDSLNLKLALNLFNQALRVDPEYVDAYGGKSNTFTEAGNYDSAMICSKRIMEIDPENSYGPGGIGLVYMYSQKPDSALKYYQKALDISPNDHWINLAMGQILFFFRNDIIKALPYYQKAYYKGGDSEVEINSNIAYIYFHIGDYPTALKYMNRAINIRPECDLIMQYASILSYQRKYDEAIQFLDSACSLNACE